MAIVSIFSGPFCHGDQVTRAVVEHTGYRRIDDEVFARAASNSGISEEKLRSAVLGKASFLGRSKRDRDKHIAQLRVALAELLQEDNLVLYGYLMHLLPTSLNHVLRVCLIANNEYREKLVVEREGVSPKQAADLVQRGDKSRSQWTDYLLGRPPYEARDYDLLLPMHELNVEVAIGQILIALENASLKTTEESHSAAGDFLLAAKVQAALVEKDYKVDVTAEDGNITIHINRYTSRLTSLQKQLVELAMGMDGVKTAKALPGTGFVPPSLMPTPDLPSKVLLVDDEQEFVQSLSERLQTRQLDTAIVFDGEQALEYVAESEPEVMVLDLKMPGIDGIEVLKRVKQTNPMIEVIILTGHGSEREEQIARELGAFAYLKKPVNIDILTQSLKDAYRKLKRDSEASEEETGG